MKERTLKVHTQSTGRPGNYPDIRIAGKWLQNQGFSVGDYVKVAYREGLIVIKKICGGDEYEQEQTRHEA